MEVFLDQTFDPRSNFREFTGARSTAGRKARGRETRCVGGGGREWDFTRRSGKQKAYISVATTRVHSLAAITAADVRFRMGFGDHYHLNALHVLAKPWTIICPNTRGLTAEGSLRVRATEGSFSNADCCPTRRPSRRNIYRPKPVSATWSKHQGRPRCRGCSSTRRRSQRRV